MAYDLVAGDPAGVLAGYPAAAAADPTDGWPHYAAALASWRAGDYQRAIQFFQRASQDPRLKSEAWYGVGSTLFRMGRYHEAAAVFRTMLTGEPRNRQTLGALAACHLRMLHWRAFVRTMLSALRIAWEEAQHADRDPGPSERR